MTTATIQFDQPTLFREGGPSRPQRETPAPAPAPIRERDAAVSAPLRERDAAVSTPHRERDARVPTTHTSTPAATAPRGRTTLDDVLCEAWEGLAGHHSVSCPVCSGSMAPRYGSGAKPVGGRCQRCGSTLG